MFLLMACKNGGSVRCVYDLRFALVAWSRVAGCLGQLARHLLFAQAQPLATRRCVRMNAPK
jgi:hypothetical protein